jgi:hypothetical protein
LRDGQRVIRITAILGSQRFEPPARIVGISPPELHVSQAFLGVEVVRLDALQILEHDDGVVELATPRLGPAQTTQSLRIVPIACENALVIRDGRVVPLEPRADSRSPQQCGRIGGILRNGAI